ncbi:MAG TPA: carboxypeptidase-like regulatory domain-containing protein [Puia sp.]
MDNTSNHSKIGSDAEIRKYLNGELSPREMHDLERAALDDPFLADALEGLMAVPPQEEDLDHLRSRLAARVDKKDEPRVIPWFRRPAFRVAAAVIGLAGIGITTWYTHFDRRPLQENAIVKNSPVVQNAPTAPAQAPAPAPAAADSIVAKTDVAKADKDLALNSRSRSLKKRAAVVEKPLPAEALASKDLSTANLPPDTTLVLRDVTSNIPLPKAELAPDPLLLSGKVVDINNRPLAGASVFLNNAPKIGTTTDAAGNFNVRIRPRDTAEQMTVALIGYKQTLVPLNATALTNNIIQLEETKARLNEVVVIGYGAKRKEAFAATPSEAGGERLDTAWQKVFPVIGKLAYQQWLDTAKQSLRLDSTSIGTERISFDVDQKGQITDFKIEQSLSPAHDAGMIQLITNGPSWRLLRGKKARALVSLRFP